MIRICHMTSAHPSDDMRIFQKECRSLARQKDFEVYLVAQGESRQESDVIVTGIGQNPVGRLKRIFSVTKKVYNKAAELNADIYHIHDPELLLYARRLKKRNNIVVFDSHEYYVQQIREKGYIPVYLRKIIAFLYKTYETHVVKKIDAVIVPCTVFGRNPFRKTTKNTILLDNYPILDRSRTFLKRINIRDKKEPKVCYVGLLSKERGITNLVKACYHAHVKLILAGRFSSNSYMEEVMKMREAECIDYRGFCDFDEVTEIYRQSDIGSAMLLKVGQYATVENLPTKAYEYMQVGLPMIMSDSRYNKQLMDENDFAYLVDPDNIEEISDAITYIIQHYEETVNKTELANKMVQEKYNWDTEFQKLLNLYNKLLKRA